MNEIIELSEAEIMIISGGLEKGKQLNNNYLEDTIYSIYDKSCSFVETILGSRVLKNCAITLALFLTFAQARWQIRHWDA